MEEKYCPQQEKKEGAKAIAPETTQPLPMRLF